VKASFPV